MLDRVMRRMKKKATLAKDTNPTTRAVMFHKYSEHVKEVPCKSDEDAYESVERSPVQNDDHVY